MMVQRLIVVVALLSLPAVVGGMDFSTSELGTWGRYPRSEPNRPENSRDFRRKPIP